MAGSCSHNIQQSYKALYEGYVSEIFNLNKSTVSDLRIQKQIKLDVPRTFACSNIPSFRVDVDEGQNPLYNVLASYAKHCPEVGYCQGMNFLAGLILIGVDFDEL